MRVLITGIDGFVAPFLARLEKDTNEVYGTYLKEPVREKGIHYIFLDLLDRNLFKKIIQQIKPERIYHLAGFSSVADSWKNPEMAMKINAEGTRNLLDAVAATEINPRILIVSSADVYGSSQDMPLTELHPLNMQSPYGKSKIEQEKIILSYKTQEVIIARSFNHTGPGQEPKFVCSAFAKQVALIEAGKIEPIILHGNLDVKRDFSDVRDVVRAYKLLAEKGKAHEVYNVCSGKIFSLHEILNTLISMSDAEIEKKLDPERIRQTDISVLVGDNSKLIYATGWSPKIDFKQTLKEILDYWRKKVSEAP